MDFLCFFVIVLLVVFFCFFCPWVEARRKDDLKRINGIGPHIESILNKEGIQTYRDFYDLSAEELTTKLRRHDVDVNLHRPEDWVQDPEEE